MATATKKVLLVEDEESIRGVIRQALQPIGITLLEAKNGEEAEALILSEHPDLVLLDVIMPKMHGIQLLQELESDTFGKTVPVTLLTNYAEDPRVVRAVKSGRCELLSKTQVSIQEIVDYVKKKLQLA